MKWREIYKTRPSFHSKICALHNDFLQIPLIRLRLVLIVTVYYLLFDLKLTFEGSCLILKPAFTVRRISIQAVWTIHSGCFLFCSNDILFTLPRYLLIISAWGMSGQILLYVTITVWGWCNFSFIINIQIFVILKWVLSIDGCSICCPHSTFFSMCVIFSNCTLAVTCAWFFLIVLHYFRCCFMLSNIWPGLENDTVFFFRRESTCRYS